MELRFSADRVPLDRVPPDGVLTDHAVDGMVRATRAFRGVSDFSSPEFQACIEATISCSTTCKANADACLARERVGDLAQSLLASLACVEICHATWQLLIMQPSEPNWRLLNKQIAKCRDACLRCGKLCALYAELHDHCRLCAESCRRCEEACTKLLAAQPHYH